MRIVRYYPRALAGDGGMTGAVKRWSRELVHAGASVVVAFEGTGAPYVADGVEWVPVHHAGSGWWKVPLGLGPVLRGADLLVLHSAWVLHNNWAAAAAERAGVAYLLEPRGAYDPHIVHRRRPAKRAWWTLLEGKLVAHARAVHVFFDAERDHLAALGYHGDFVTAPNGIQPPEGVHWDGGSGGYVLWLGRFDPEHKGIDLLVRAVHQLPAYERPSLRLQGPDFRDGTGGGKERVLQLVHELALEPWVTVGDPVHGAEKWALLSRAVGFVYPSRWEAFGNSVAEAVSIGVPTLVTPYPLGRYLESRGGAVLAEATPESLAAGLRALHAPAARAVGERGARAVRDGMRWDGVARSWLDQISGILCKA